MATIEVIELKLYVWQEVLRDYTSGVAFALATSEDEARRLIIEKLGWDDESMCVLAEQFDKSPVIVSSPQAFYCYGGG